MGWHTVHVSTRTLVPEERPDNSRRAARSHADCARQEQHHMQMGVSATLSRRQRKCGAEDVDQIYSEDLGSFFTDCYTRSQVRTEHTVEKSEEPTQCHEQSCVDTYCIVIK